MFGRAKNFVLRTGNWRVREFLFCHGTRVPRISAVLDPHRCARCSLMAATAIGFAQEGVTWSNVLRFCGATIRPPL